MILKELKHEIGSPLVRAFFVWNFELDVELLDVWSRAESVFELSSPRVVASYAARATLGGERENPDIVKRDNRVRVLKPGVPLGPQRCVRFL